MMKPHSSESAANRESPEGDDHARARLAYVANLKTLGEMAGGIAHEINNPLTIIGARAAFLKDRATKGELDAAVAIEVAERITAVVFRISGIVQGLRAFAQEGSDEPAAAVLLSELVEDALAFCRERMRNHGVELRLAPVPEGLIAVCRPIQISQVLLNLLNNAFDAVSDGEKRWVALDVATDGVWAEIRVTDSGPGVPAAIRERIFEPFFTTKDPGRGMGLGLSISRRIMDAHGGGLTLDSAHPQTRFVARWPLGREGA